MRGCIRKRGRTWTAYFDVRDGVGRHQRSQGGFRTKADANKWLTTSLAAAQTGDLVAPSRLLFGDYLTQQWLPTAERLLRPSTLDSYQRLTTRHVIPALGHLPLQELRPQHLDVLYSTLLRTGHVSGQGGLAPKTVHYIHTIIHKALKDAERKGLVLRNVADAADSPRLNRSGNQTLRTWTAPQLRGFLEAVSDHPLYAAFLLGATTGMRRGELLGLRWSDIEWQPQRLSVRQTLLSVNYKLSFGTPKTQRGRRSIALDDRTVAALRDHRREQRRQLEVTETANHTDLVFLGFRGGPVHPDYFSQLFKRQIAKLDLPEIRLHDLRHTHATLGLGASVPAKVISDRLGHATVAFTQDIYMHSIPQLDSDSAAKIADLIFAVPPHSVEEGVVS